MNLLSLEYFTFVSDVNNVEDNLPFIPEDHPRAWLWNEMIAYQSGNYQLALELLQPKVNTGDPYALEVKAWIYEAQGDYQNSIQIYKYLNNTKGLLNICSMAKDAGDFDNAFNACNSAWEIDYKISTYAYAILLIDFGEFESAETILRNSLERIDYFKYRPYWLFKLATVLEKQGRWAEAIKIHMQGNAEQQRLGSKVKRPSYYYADLAWAYHMNGQTEEAFSTTQKAIDQLEQDDDLFYIWFRAGQIYETAGLLPRALAAYQFCLEQRPNDRITREAVERLFYAIQE